MTQYVCACVYVRVLPNNATAVVSKIVLELTRVNDRARKGHRPWNPSILTSHSSTALVRKGISSFPLTDTYTLPICRLPRKN